MMCVVVALRARSTIRIDNEEKPGEDPAGPGKRLRQLGVRDINGSRTALCRLMLRGLYDRIR